jgi:N-acetylated-alpha-linked acidic dipeptidase
LFGLFFLSPHFSSFTQLPHLAGTEQNLLLAKKIQTQWKNFGLDSADLVHYDVLLSYPNETNANYISVVDEHGTEVNGVVCTFQVL